MHLIETTILEKSVRLRLADNFDPAKASEWIDIHVLISNLKGETGKPLDDPQTMRLALVQRAALRYAQDTITDETRSLLAKADRTA